MGKHKVYPNRLKETKELLGISLRELAKEVGWTPQRAQECYHNRSQLPVWVAVEIQHVFGVNAAYVLGIQDNPTCDAEVRTVTRYVDVECSYHAEEMKQAIEAINQAKAQASLSKHRLNKALRLIEMAGGHYTEKEL
jgi:plasmid maintenance system antidote protein VapI